MGFSYYDLAWTKIKKITIPAAQLGGSGSLTDQRVLISVTDADVQAAAQADGDDILFCDHTGDTKLDHALKSYDNGTGAILAWVLIPTIADASSDYDFYCYYGNGACGAQENPDGVWKDASVKPAVAVYNFDGDVLDSSGNGYDATNFGTSDVAGKVGNCRSFDGANDYLTAPHADFSVIEQDSTFSVLALVKLGATGVRQQIMVKGNTGSETLSLYVNSLGKVVFEDYDAGTYDYYAIGATNICDNTWHRIAGVRNGSTFKVYVDGVDDTSATSEGAETHTTTEDVYFGKRLNDDYLVDGDVDELWIINGVLSDNEALADFNSIDDPSTFMTFSAEMTFVEATREMNYFPLEEIEADLDMPWWHDQLRADREMQVSLLEQLYADRDMNVSLWQGPDVIANREMVISLLEEIQADEEMPETILEWIKHGLEPPTPVLQHVYQDESMIFGQSQDRADDREMPITLLEQITASDDMPITILEQLTVDEELPISIVKGLYADREPNLFQLEGINEDEEMPLGGPSEIIVAVVSDQEMPFFLIQGVHGDEEPVITLLENLYADREMNVYVIGGLAASDEEMPTSLLEYISVTRTPNLFIVAPTHNDEEIPVDVLQYLREDQDMPVTLSEHILEDLEPIIQQYKGIHGDEEMPATLLENILNDIGMPTYLREYILNDLEMPVSLSKEYPPVPITPADRLMPLYIMANVSADRELITTLREFIVADGDMPIEWWDEVKYKIPAGIYELLNQTLEYRLEVLGENELRQRTEMKLIGKS